MPLLGFLHARRVAALNFLRLPVGFRRGGGLYKVTIQHLPKLSNLAVDALLLRLEALDSRRR